VKKCIPMLPHAAYSPDLSPCDFYVFPKLKSRVKGHHFQTLDSVQKNFTGATKTITEADCQSCYEARIICWTKCVASESCYFEGGVVHSDE
jgi:hypothetical protein